MVAMVEATGDTVSTDVSFPEVLFNFFIMNSIDLSFWTFSIGCFVVCLFVFLRMRKPLKRGTLRWNAKQKKE